MKTLKLSISPGSLEKKMNYALLPLIYLFCLVHKFQVQLKRFEVLFTLCFTFTGSATYWPIFVLLSLFHQC